MEQKGNKKIKREKPVDLDAADFEEEEGDTGKRRSRRLAKLQARYK